ncbi:hypothetical protein RF11_10876 [Thelohanellus kitauei]|uniref:Uncharacterized protein n=1 Tax=Thelohanellus kitauei TaxID=669202 RepID=A0A0C2I6I8_THEKT|nr:hypothetical protein RF11_10876 [Thelohanellus kitauei]
MLKAILTDRSIRLQMEERIQSNSDMIKILIDNVILLIKLNVVMFLFENSVSMWQNTFQFQSFLSKSYDFEFVECINLVLKTDTMSERRKSIEKRQKLLQNHIWSNCEVDLMQPRLYFDRNKKFYSENEHSLQKMAMFKSDCTSVMLGKYNGVAAILKREIHHLCELHCVAHRKDLAVQDAWTQILSMI